ncbi:MAG: hypothetical protein F6K11_23085 [Leptolyngbya sp. SIO3F4]|nr:hypothetical protein [Leptolyngbya sp. SIO3F4]
MLSAVAVPVSLSLVSPTVGTLTAEHSLAWANPGNSVGRLFGYALASGAVSASFSAARRVERVTLSGVITLTASTLSIVLSFLVTKALVTFWIAPELGLLSAVAASGLVMVLVSKWLFPEYGFDGHVRGPELTTSKAVRAERGARHDGQLPWGADWIDFYRETVHFLLLGNIGGGKTQFLKREHVIH